MEQWLYFSGAFIFIAMSAIHLIFTLIDIKTPTFLAPRSDKILSAMQNEPLKLTKETSMWQAWLGFNISHSIGGLFIGSFYAYMALFEFSKLLSVPFAFITAPIIAWTYALLARNFWFSRPLRGLTLSALLFSTGAIVAMMKISVL